MKLQLFMQNRFSIILLISIILGVFLSFYELPRLFQSEILEATSRDYLIIALNFLFITLLSVLLIYVNTIRIKRAENILHLLYSVLLVILFWSLIWIVIDPMIETANDTHAIAYETYSKEQNLDVWAPKQRNNHARYFHDRVADSQEQFLFLLIGVYMLSRIYNLSVRKKETENNYEKLKNETLQSQISALNNQINPHSFFNALNSLHSLIVEEQKNKSLTYLSNMSNVFRYILQSEKKDLVSLAEEFIFLDTYRFMLSVKYDQKLKFDIQVDKADMMCKLPILSLLPIIENAIKHNEISNKHPMVIYIYIDQEQYLVVKNEKREKLDLVDSVGIGLNNLNNRFKLLAQKEIKIDNTAQIFSVHLPLICV